MNLRGNATHVERGTCEAGGRIKPGAQAPGSNAKNWIEPAERATALPPASRAQTPFFISLPGACAPGFMLSPASRASDLRTIAQDGETYSTVYRGVAVLCVRDGDFCCRGGNVAVTVSHPQRDGVNAPVAVAFALRTQLH